MSSLVDFLTSTEIIVVYIVTLVTVLLCLIIYLFDKGAEKRKQKQNTKELNRIVVEEEPTKEVVEEKETEYIEEPVIVQPTIKNIETANITDLKDEEPEIEELVIDEPQEELTYTNIEPNKEEATAELMKLTETLEKSLNEAEQDNISISVQKYEEDQEKDAIISYDELLERTKELHINEELKEPIQENSVPVILQGQTIEETSTIPTQAYTEDKSFKSSPIISPVYGLSNNELEIENTANFEKLDAELLKSNLFLDKLKKFKEDNNYDR